MENFLNSDFVAIVAFPFELVLGFIAISLIMIGAATACALIYGAVLYLCMGIALVFGKLVLDPIEYVFTSIFRRLRASA